MAATHFSMNHAGSVSVNPPSIATVSKAAVDVTITGLAVGDLLVMHPPTALDDDLIYCGCRVKAADTATIFLYNPTGGAIDDAAQTWTYEWIDFT